MGGKNRRVSPISTVTSEGHREVAVDDAGSSRFVASTRKRRDLAAASTLTARPSALL